MSGKGLIWGGMIVGSTIGSFLPYLWNGGAMAYVLFGAIGGVAGIWLAFKIAKGTGTF